MRLMLTPISQHLGRPSEWIVRYAHLVREAGHVLDLAAGAGRHARYFLEHRHTVTAVDYAADGLMDLDGRENLTIVLADVEDLSLPLWSERFDGVVVTNFLYRPLLKKLPHMLTQNGVLLYETFSDGQQEFGRPKNRDFLLKSGELLEFSSLGLQIVAYECGIQSGVMPRVVQRIAAVNTVGPCKLGSFDENDLFEASETISRFGENF